MIHFFFFLVYCYWGWVLFKDKISVESACFGVLLGSSFLGKAKWRGWKLYGLVQWSPFLGLIAEVLFGPQVISPFVMFPSLTDSPKHSPCVSAPKSVTQWWSAWITCHQLIGSPLWCFSVHTYYIIDDSSLKIVYFSWLYENILLWLIGSQGTIKTRTQGK